LNNRRTRTYENAVLNNYRTTERRARRNVYVASNAAVMVNTSARVNDAVLPYLATGLDNGSRHYLDTILERNSPRNPCGWMHERRKFVTSCTQSVVSALSQISGSALSDTQD
jgi:hypothetical protein